MTEEAKAQKDNRSPMYENEQARYVPGIGFLSHEIVPTPAPIIPASSARVDELEQALSNTIFSLNIREQEIEKLRKELHRISDSLSRLDSIDQGSEEGRKIIVQLRERLSYLEGGFSVFKDFNHAASNIVIEPVKSPNLYYLTSVVFKAL